MVWAGEPQPDSVKGQKIFTKDLLRGTLFFGRLQIFKVGVHCPLSYHSGNKVIPLFCSTSIATTSFFSFHLCGKFSARSELVGLASINI